LEGSIWCSRRGTFHAQGIGQRSALAEGRLAPVRNVETPNSDPYIQDLLKKTEEKREERAKARLNDYYRRNFKVCCPHEAVKRTRWHWCCMMEHRLLGRRIRKPERVLISEFVAQEYFEFEGGAARARGISPETAKQIKEWLQDNKS
jgi:hypothetical protein